jgi:hypothetical protein
MNEYYVYAYLDPRKNGNFSYGEKYFFNYEPFYIGKGKNKRLFKHISCDLKRGYNAYKDNKIKKIISLKMNPIIVKIAECLSEEEAFIIEIDAIKVIGRKYENGPLTNIYDGGYGSSKSEETKMKISETKKRKYANGECIHPLLGTKWSEETRGKILKRRKEKPIVWNNEQKIRLKKIRCENKNKTQTEYWEVTSPEGKMKVIYGLGEFCRNNNLQQAHMFSVSTGSRKHHKGWKCRKVNPTLFCQVECQNTPI